MSASAASEYYKYNQSTKILAIHIIFLAHTEVTLSKTNSSHRIKPPSYITQESHLP